MRSCACFGAPLSVIEPCGFPLTAKALRRTAMDYGAPEMLTRHKSWEAFKAISAQGRLVLFTTKGATALSDFKFQNADARVIIPIVKGARSFNLSVSVGIAIFEALRQTNQLPKHTIL